MTEGQETGGQETEDQDTLCLICLEGVSSQNPLYLLACGCRTSWFHHQCEHLWISSLPPVTAGSILCPVCRRPIGLTTNYCFTWTAGPEQLKLWICGVAALLELLYVGFGTFYGYSHLGYLSGSTTIILLLPLGWPRTIWTYDGYVTHALIHFLGETLVLGLCLLQNSPYTQVVELQFVVSFLHIMVIFLVHIVETQDPTRRKMSYEILFFPYAISREILHADILVSAEPIASPTERNERRRRRCRAHPLPPRQT